MSMTDDRFTTLLGFLRTGQLDQLKLGMTAREVISYLGAPDGYEHDTFDINQVRPDNAIYMSICYGCLELAFSGEYFKKEHIDKNTDPLCVISINLDENRTREFPGIIRNDWLVAVDGMTGNQFVDFLQQHEIHWVLNRMSMPEALFLDILPSCVSIVINLEDGSNKIVRLARSKYSESEIDCASKLQGDRSLLSLIGIDGNK